MRTAVLAGAVVVISTEVLSAFHALTRAAVVSLWICAGVAGLVWLWRRRATLPPLCSEARLGIVDALLIASIAVIMGIVAFTALVSPPNSADAMAYHLPRVVYWIQNKSVSFFSTPYLAQIMLQPFAEYGMLHTWLLSGGDRFVNLVQWFGGLTSIVGVTLLAGHFGASRRGQILAALFCATLPNGILQASGAKNDYLLAAWLVPAAWFLIRRDIVFAGLAIGLALGTKATAYLYLPALILVLIAPAWREWRARLPQAAAIAAIAVALNLPQYLRNLDLSGSPLGFDSSQADGKYRFRNESPGWKSTVSNVLRHSAEQLGARSEHWNQRVYDRVAAAHQALGIDLDDPSTTWPESHYGPPRNPNHEANTPNRWHLAILVNCAVFLAWRWRYDRAMLCYLASLIAGFVLFCFYLKWQPFQARLFLPLFVLASPIAGALLGRLRPAFVQLALCVFLLNATRPYLFENWVRPLKGPHSLVHTARRDNYFNDMTQWNNRPAYLATVETAAASGCDFIGIDINEFQLEYPFQALLLERNPHVRFVHTGVKNPSRKYEQSSLTKPCLSVRLQP